MKITDRLSDLAKKLTGARDALRSLHGVEQELRAAHAEALAERRQILQAPPARSDVEVGISTTVTRWRREWAERHAATLIPALGGRLDISMDERTLTPVPPGFPDGFDELPLRLDVLCAIAPGVVIEGLRRLVGDHQYPEGPPIADRPEVVSALDRRIAKIEADHTALADSAAALNPPIVIECLEPVAARRRAAKVAAEQKRAAWERDVAANREFYKRHPDRRPPEPPAA